MNNQAEIIVNFSIEATSDGSEHPYESVRKAAENAGAIVVGNYNWESSDWSMAPSVEYRMPDGSTLFNDAGGASSCPPNKVQA
jgi:hypothetical protein